MPETAVDKDDLFPAGENEIRRPRQVGAMETVAEALRMEQSANQQFRSSVLALDRLHRLAPDRRRLHRSLPLNSDQIRFFDDRSSPPNRGFPDLVGPPVFDLEVHVIDFLWMAAKAIIHCLQKAHLFQGLCRWTRVV